MAGGAERYAYGYLIGALVYAAVWAVLFWRRPDLQREMAVMGGLMALYAVPHEALLYTRDWWHPPTITGTRVGVEDLLYAIGNGGVLAVICAIALRRRTVPDAPLPPLGARLLPYAVNALVPPFLVVVGLHSFVASGVGALLALALVLRARPDLAGVAVGSALIGTLVALPVYWLIEALLPGFIAYVWYLDRLSGVLVTGIPVEDLLWYLYTAALCGTYYKFASGRRLASGVARAGPVRR